MESEQSQYEELLKSLPAEKRALLELLHNFSREEAKYNTDTSDTGVRIEWWASDNRQLTSTDMLTEAVTSRGESLPDPDDASGGYVGFSWDYIPKDSSQQRVGVSDVRLYSGGDSWILASNYPFMGGMESMRPHIDSVIKNISYPIVVRQDGGGEIANSSFAIKFGSS